MIVKVLVAVLVIVPLVVIFAGLATALCFRRDGIVDSRIRSPFDSATDCIHALWFLITKRPVAHARREDLEAAVAMAHD
ncbi:hypothetical protein PSPO01_13449 [Paraphaeosphaeria sporulosa]